MLPWWLAGYAVLMRLLDWITSGIVVQIVAPSMRDQLPQPGPQRSGGGPGLVLPDRRRIPEGDRRVLVPQPVGPGPRVIAGCQFGGGVVPQIVEPVRPPPIVPIGTGRIAVRTPGHGAGQQGVAPVGSGLNT